MTDKDVGVDGERLHLEVERSSQTSSSIPGLKVAFLAYFVNAP